jgi:hypothetical protein
VYVNKDKLNQPIFGCNNLAGATRHIYPLVKQLMHLYKGLAAVKINSMKGRCVHTQPLSYTTFLLQLGGLTVLWLRCALHHAACVITCQV